MGQVMMMVATENEHEYAILCDMLHILRRLDGDEDGWVIDEAGLEKVIEPAIAYGLQNGLLLDDDNRLKNALAEAAKAAWKARNVCA